MWHHLVIGILLGWGVAIPIGPMNLEIVRRNLRFGTHYGVLLGVGVCIADLTCFALLSLGAIAVLTYAPVLRTISVVGALILAWFGISALRLKPELDASTTIPALQPKLWRQCIDGYLMTLISPFTIIFWASISTQFAALAHEGLRSGILLAIGLTIGTISWIFGLNVALHFTKRRMSQRMIAWLNRIGGLLLIGFSLFSMWHAFHIK